MLTVPAAIPVTTPKTGCTVAMEADPVVQVPPAVPLLSVMFDSVQTDAEPVIPVGGALTQTTVAVLQPVGRM